MTCSPNAQDCVPTWRSYEASATSQLVLRVAVVNVAQQPSAVTWRPAGGDWVTGGACTRSFRGDGALNFSTYGLLSP